MAALLLARLAHTIARALTVHLMQRYTVGLTLLVSKVVFSKVSTVVI